MPNTLTVSRLGLAVFVFALPALLAGRRHLRLGTVLFVVLICADIGFGWFRLTQPEPAASRSPDVRNVQPSVDLSEKWDAAVRDRMARRRHQHAEGHSDHEHRPGCGHPAVAHEDHVDYLHSGHLHAQHAGHYDEHGTA